MTSLAVKYGLPCVSQSSTSFPNTLIFTPRTHACSFNGHFPGKPDLAGFPRFFIFIHPYPEHLHGTGLTLHILCDTISPDLTRASPLLSPLKRRYQLVYTFFFFWYSAVLTAGQWLPSLGRRQSTTKNSDHCHKTSSKQPSMTGGRRQLTSKNSGHSCKTSSKQPSMGIMSREY